MKELRSGVVAIAGRPNVGKSTLLNRVLGAELSIVTFKAQTTREQVRGIHNEEERGQIVFVDTPGIHRAKKGGINEAMMFQAQNALEAPDMVWYLVDPLSGESYETPVLELLKECPAPIALIGNKADREKSPGPLLEKLRAKLEAQGNKVHSVRRISALKKKGIQELLDATWEAMPTGPFLYPPDEALSDRPLRFFVAEKIREQLYTQLGDELPYCCAVEVEAFEESPKMNRIRAVIHVERDSQKGMVIGKGASKIKSIGQDARKAIEQFTETRAHLELHVKVWKDWSKDRDALRRMGFDLPEEGKRS